MPNVTRKIGFDAGHRVTLHESKCKNAHGHRYTAEVTVWAPGLDEAGRVVDFGVVKDVVGGWIDEHLDHGYIYRPGDAVGEFIKSQGQKTYIMPEGREPTAENIAEVIGRRAQALLEFPLRVQRVRLYETPNCWADWVP